MTDDPSMREDKIRSFWDRYINKLHESGITPPFDRWMVRRAEDYIAALLAETPDAADTEESPA